MEQIFKINEEKKFVEYCNNDLDREHVNQICDYLNNGYTVNVSSWCTGATRVQYVVYGTVNKVKHVFGDKVQIEYDGNTTYPEANLKLA